MHGSIGVNAETKLTNTVDNYTRIYNSIIE